MATYDPSIDADKMRALMQLAASLAYPLSSVATALAAEADLLSRPDAEVYLGPAAALIKHNARRVESIASNLLTFAGQQSIQPLVLSVAAVLSELEPLLRRLVGESVMLTIDCADNVFLIHADLRQFEEIICTLVARGRDVMPNGGLITVRVANLSRSERPDLGGDFVYLEIADTGAAIPSHLLLRMFEPILARKSYGLWLGLSTVYGAVTQMRGKITVESASPNGSKFTILLPAYSSQ